MLETKSSSVAGSLLTIRNNVWGRVSDTARIVTDRLAAAPTNPTAAAAFGR